MPQNIYDNPAFFEGYEAMRQRKLAVDDVIVIPNMQELIGGVEGLDVLDIGCGTGERCQWLSDSEAKSVTGTDISERMLAVAAEQTSDRVTYIRSSAEESSFDPDSFDVVVSALMLQYVEDIDPLLRKIYTWLRPGGRYVVSMEHPMSTSAQGLIEERWVRDENGREIAWVVGNYGDEGRRVSEWFVDGVVRYHRTTATIINSLVDAGFRIQRVLEPHAIEEAEREAPILLTERISPAFLFISAEAMRDTEIRRMQAD